MKKIILLITSIFILISCSKTNEEILNKVSTKLSNIKSIKYSSTFEIIDNGQAILKNKDTICLDFVRDNNPSKLNFHFISKEREVIYNGIRTYQSDNKEKIITTSDDNTPEYINPSLILTLNPLKYILPKIIQDKNIRILRKNDTIIGNEQLFVFNFTLKKRYIDLVNYELKDGINYDTEYFLFVNKLDFLPYKIIIPNGKNASMSRTIENPILDLKISQDIWNGKRLPKDYPTFTEKEYSLISENNLLTNLGGKITNWELPNLENDSLVNVSKLKGKIVLLEFWFKNCGACIAAIPSLNKIKTKFENEKFEIYGVEFNENYPKDILEKYIKDKKMLYPTLYKGKTVASNYGIKSAPTFLTIDKNGIIIDIKDGFSIDGMNEIIEIIDNNI